MTAERSRRSSYQSGGCAASSCYWHEIANACLPEGYAYPQCQLHPPTMDTNGQSLECTTISLPVTLQSQMTNTTDERSQEAGREHINYYQEQQQHQTTLIETQQNGTSLLYAVMPPQQIPHITVTQCDTLTVTLSHNVLVEISLANNIRVCQLGSVAASLSGNGQTAAIHHPAARLVQDCGGDLVVDLQHNSRIRVDRNQLVRVYPATMRCQQCNIHNSHQPAPPQSLDTRCQELLLDAKVNQQHETHWVIDRKGEMRAELSPNWMVFNGQMEALNGAPLPLGMDMTTEVFLYEPMTVTGCRQQTCVNRASQAYMQNDMLQRQVMMVYVDGVRIRQDLTTGDVRVYMDRNYLSLGTAPAASLTVHSPTIDLTIDKNAEIRVINGDDNFFIQTGPTEMQVGIQGTHIVYSFDAFGHPIRNTFAHPPSIASGAEGDDGTETKGQGVGVYEILDDN